MTNTSWLKIVALTVVAAVILVDAAPLERPLEGIAESRSRPHTEVEPYFPPAMSYILRVVDRGTRILTHNTDALLVRRNSTSAGSDAILVKQIES